MLQKQHVTCRVSHLCLYLGCPIPSIKVHSLRGCTRLQKLCLPLEEILLACRFCGVRTICVSLWAKYQRTSNDFPTSLICTQSAGTAALSLLILAATLNARDVPLPLAERLHWARWGSANRDPPTSGAGFRPATAPAKLVRCQRLPLQPEWRRFF